MYNCRNPAENVTADQSTNYNFTKKWIVANMFETNKSNEMIKFATNKSSNIDGLIFICDQSISSEMQYENPTLIAAIDEYEGAMLNLYTYKN